MTSLGIYVHIPFCHARCGYCDFVTFTEKENQIPAYVDAVASELALYGPQESRPAETLFFGGGTPSLLDGRQAGRLVKAAKRELHLISEAEITLEANPESVTKEKAHAWREAGVNRISLGLQAADDTLLKAMDRLHTVDQFVDAYRAIRQVGFGNVSIDLIYGFETQSMESWRATLRSVVVLQPEHLSLYALGIEPHTPFAAQGKKVDPDRQAEMYQEARTFLADAGYHQYEISNFSLPGFECRHNLLYWRQQDYIGAGVGAVGCVNGLRWQNHKSLPPYFKDVENGRKPRESEEPLPDHVRRFEYLMLGLRLREGIAWGDESDPRWASERTRLASEGLLEEFAPGRWRIPDRAIALTNQVLLPFA